MPIYTNKDSGRIYVQFQYKGQQFKQYLPAGTTKTQAHKLEVKMRADAFFQANGMAPRDEVVFEDAVHDYLAHIKANTRKYQKAEYVLIAAKPFLKTKGMRSIKPIDIERYMALRSKQPSMHDRPRKPATIWREVAVLSAFFTYCIKSGYCEINPCRQVEKPTFDNVQNTILSKEDEARFLAAFDPQAAMARDACILVLNTGLRQNDVLGLTDFNISGRFIELVQGKTRRRVSIPLNDVAMEVINQYRGHGLLFPSQHIFTKGKPMQYIRRAIAGACKRAGIDRLTIRDLRRTFATRLAENGEDALTIAGLLGHSDLRMVHRYARTNELMLKAVEKLAKPSDVTLQSMKK